MQSKELLSILFGTTKSIICPAILKNLMKVNFAMLLRQNAMETLLNKKCNTKNCDNLKLVLEKRKILKDIYKNVKNDSIAMIQEQLLSIQLCLLECKIITSKM